MKNLLLLAMLTVLPSVALADNQCEKSADGEVTCQQVSGESGKESETTDQPVKDAQPTEDATQREPENAEGGEFGDETTQSRENGITY